MDDLELMKEQQKQEIRSYLESTKNDSMYKNEFYREGSQSVEEKKALVPGSEFNDKVKLGSKIFKAKNDAQRAYNAKIDESLKLTEKATAYTAETQYIVSQVEKNIYNDENSGMTGKFEPETMLYRLKNYCFTPEMFSSANIRANLAEYVALVKGYQELKNYDDRHYITLLGDTAKIMDLFKKRIEIYLEQNRVDMSGKIILDRVKPRSMDPGDLAAWNEFVSQKHESDKAEDTNVTDEMLRQEITDMQERLEGAAERYGLYNQKSFLKYQIEHSSYEGRKEIMKVEDFHAQSMIVLNGRILLNTLKLKLREESKRDDITEDEKKANLDALKKEIEETNQDLSALAERDMKRTIKEIARRDTVKVSAYKLTRAEATDTASDRACLDKKREFTELSERLDVVLDSAKPFRTAEMLQTTRFLRDAVKAYAASSHYREGHKQETKLLMKALQELRTMEGYSKADLDFRPEVRDIARELRVKFDALTMGSTTIPAIEDIPENLVYIPQGNPEESTSKNKGGTRNAIMMSDMLREWKSERDTPLFSHEPTVNDLRQGKVSNCYMVAGTTGLVGLDPQILKNAIRDNGNGTVTVRLFRKGSRSKAIPIYVVVTKEVPKLITGGDILSSGALWMQLIEKAAASVGKSSVDYGYQSLWYGEGGDWLFRLTGKQPQTIISDGDVAARIPSQKEPGKMTDYLSEEGKDILFEEIMHAKDTKTVFNCGTGEDASDALNAGHAYTILGAKVVSGTRYVILRNPYANMSLRYDDQDRMYMKHGRTLSYFSTGIGETCGQFAMSFDEFLKEMNKVTKTDLSEHFEEARENPGQWLRDYMEEVDNELEEQRKAAEKMMEGDELLRQLDNMED